MASGSKKPSVNPGKSSAKARRRRRSGRQENTLDMMKGLLTRRVSIRISGEARQVPAMKAIFLQLMQKAMAGNAHAWRVFLKYQEFAKLHGYQSIDLIFVESDYTRAFAKFPSRSDDG
jgi:hypothetical protein